MTDLRRDFRVSCLWIGIWIFALTVVMYVLQR